MIIVNVYNYPSKCLENQLKTHKKKQLGPIVFFSYFFGNYPWNWSVPTWNFGSFYVYFQWWAGETCESSALNQQLWWYNGDWEYYQQCLGTVWVFDGIWCTFNFWCKKGFIMSTSSSSVCTRVCKIGDDSY